MPTFHELQPLLEKALAQETKDDTAHEMAVTARGLAKAAEILAGQFTLVATNVPYLARGKQSATNLSVNALRKTQKLIWQLYFSNVGWTRVRMAGRLRS